MFILRSLLEPLQTKFKDIGERGTWFIYTLLSIILPFTASRASNVLRSLTTLFGFDISSRRFYIFMASRKLPWEALWPVVWRLIHSPATEGRILLAGDDSVNPKTGKEIFGCHYFFDHAAKQNQSDYAWAQNIVQLGLLKWVHGRFACLPLAWCFYRLRKDTKSGFKTKLEQMSDMVEKVVHCFKEPLLLITDSWFGNDGLFKPLRLRLGGRVHILSRLRTNANLFDVLIPRKKKGRGRPRKYGEKRGTAKTLSNRLKRHTNNYQIFLYGKTREVHATDRVLLLKTIKIPVRVVWVYYRTQWVALFTTDLTLTVEQIITYYGARWKIESGFKELKQEIGSQQTQTRVEPSVTNHLNFCMMAVTITWIYCSRLRHAPIRRHVVRGRDSFAFSDVRYLISEAIVQEDFCGVLNKLQKPEKNKFISTILKLVA
jgi:hypothetical protein